MMSGSRAIGRDSLGKNIIQCQTSFFFAQLSGTGERTMCLFSPHPQTSSALPFSSPLCLIHLFFTSLLLLALGTFYFPPLSLKERKQSCETRWAHPLPIAGWLQPQFTAFGKERFMYLILPSLLPKQSILKSFYFSYISDISLRRSNLLSLSQGTALPVLMSFSSLHNSIAKACWNLLEWGWYAQVLEPA